MATQEVTLSGNWQVGHTATTNNTSIIFTPRRLGINWAVRSDTNVPVGDFMGHVAQGNVDREVFLAAGETVFFNGDDGRIVYTTITAG